jgi:hypothetical protein
MISSKTGTVNIFPAIPMQILRPSVVFSATVLCMRWGIIAVAISFIQKIASKTAPIVCALTVVRITRIFALRLAKSSI